MAFQLYLRRSPRTLYLVGADHALVFRHIQQVGEKTTRGNPTAIVELQQREDVPMEELIRINKARGLGGVLGLTSVPSDAESGHEIFLVLAAGAITLPPILPGTSLAPSKLLNVEFHSLSTALWDEASTLSRSGSAFDLDGTMEGYDTPDPDERPMAGARRGQTLAQQQGLLTHPCDGMKRYIETGTFYFACDNRWDISTRLAEWDWQAMKDRSVRPGQALDSFDDRFVWNANILQPLLEFRKGLPPDQLKILDSSNMLIMLIQGFCGVMPVGGMGAMGQSVNLGLISRLGWKRAGARFRTRGIDDEGNVANFVETETLLSTQDICMSFVQVRGSVPLFWEQQGIKALGGQLQITRPQAASQAAFGRHFIDLLEHYHAVHAVNLLGSRGEEFILSKAYENHLQSFARELENDFDGKPTVSLTPYDFHAAVKIGGHDVVKEDFGRRLHSLADALRRFGWTTIDRQSGVIVEKQQGVFRTNCLDCLDRTNYVQDVISTLTVSSFLSTLPPGQSLVSSSILASSHRTLWADNGDSLSRIYAGTGALNTSVTRTGKRTLGSILSDTTKSLGRVYTNTFLDSDKQKSIDLLLGLMSGQQEVKVHNPVAEAVAAALSARLSEYSTERSLEIFAGTWNLNGRPPGESLNAWLFPPGAPDCDIYVIGLQEVVPLNAQQVIQTDPQARKLCEAALVKVFDKHRSGPHPYIQLRSEQLVGTCLIMYIRSDILPAVTRVEAANVKTGLRGMSGNKGGLGIRLQLHDTTFCFMTCHLAAGHSNVAERNADYATINHDLKFLRGKTIEEHHVILWFADFNYRIDLDNETARDCASTGDLQTLWEADQLRMAMLGKDAFAGYDEGAIRFAPTYKYDVGTNTYDSSEKARIPAWTDRVLFRGRSIQQKVYARAELLTSDHRPVYSIFSVATHDVDEMKKATIAKQIADDLRGKISPSNGMRDLEKSFGQVGLKNEIQKEKIGLLIPTGNVDSARRAPPPTPPTRSTPPSAVARPDSPSSTGSSTAEGFVMVPSSQRQMLPPPRRSDSALSKTSTKLNGSVSSLINTNIPKAQPVDLLELESPTGSKSITQAPMQPRRLPPRLPPGKPTPPPSSTSPSPIKIEPGKAKIPPMVPPKPRKLSTA